MRLSLGYPSGGAEATSAGGGALGPRSLGPRSLEPRSLERFEGTEEDAVGDVGLALPTGAGGKGTGICPPGAVVLGEVCDRMRGERRGRRAEVDEGLSAGAEERGGAAGAPELDPPSSLVEEAVMGTTDEQGVGQLRLASVRPVVDVMGIGEPEPTSGEAASAVANLECTAERGWDGAGAPTHVEDRVVRSVGDPDEGGVAGETPRRFS